MRTYHVDSLFFSTSPPFPGTSDLVFFLSFSALENATVLLSARSFAVDFARSVIAFAIGISTKRAIIYQFKHRDTLTGMKLIFFPISSGIPTLIFLFSVLFPIYEMEVQSLIFM